MKFKLRRYYLYYLARSAIFLIYLLPRRAGLAIFEKLGYLAYSILPKYRRIAQENLRTAFRDEKPEREIREIARQVFGNLGKNAFELIQFPKINKDNIDKIVETKNTGIIDTARKKGKGVIILASHFGNWELLAATLKLKDYPGYVIGRRIYFKKFDDYLNHLRKLHNVDIIYRDESPRKFLKILKENSMIGILADQDVDSVEGVFVNFFGRDTYTPVGPAALARATGASIIPVFMIRKNGRHELQVEPPVELIDTGDKEKDMVTNTQRWTNVLESYIRKYPDQWVWVHRRWKTTR